MKKTLTIIVNPSVDNTEYIKFLSERFNVKTLQGINDTSDLRNSNAVLLIDGPDVNPQYYTEKLGKHTTIDKSRDVAEKSIVDLCKKTKQLKIGFGRGAQLMTALSGGKVVQHINGHRSAHAVACNKVRSTFAAPSDHSQMMYPYELPESKYELIAWSKRFQSTTYLDGNNEEMQLDEEFLEPEIVYYNNTNALCFQGIPVGGPREYREVVLELIDSYLK